MKLLKTFIYHLIHDFLYDLYAIQSLHPAYSKKDRIVEYIMFAIHWGIWVIGYILAFAFIILLTIYSIKEQYYIIAVFVNIVWFVVNYVFIQHYKVPDRDTIVGVNDKWRVR